MAQLVDNKSIKSKHNLRLTIRIGTVIADILLYLYLTLTAESAEKRPSQRHCYASASLSVSVSSFKRFHSPDFFHKFLKNCNKEAQPSRRDQRGELSSNPSTIYREEAYTVVGRLQASFGSIQLRPKYIAIIVGIFRSLNIYALRDN